MEYRIVPERSFLGFAGWLCAIVLFTPGAAAQAQQQADIILHNGKILTVDKDFSTAQAVAVTGRHLSAVGRNDDVLKRAGADTLVLDLKGRTVVPGAIDTHGDMGHGASREMLYGKHLPPEALNRYPIDWRGVAAKQDALNQIKGTIEKYKFKPGEWVHFVGSLNPGAIKILYDELDRWDLDKVSPDNPIAINTSELIGLSLLINSKGIEAIWNDMGYADFIQKYGRYTVDKNGQPTGHLEPPAARVINNVISNRPTELLAPMIKSLMEERRAIGITTMSSTVMGDFAKGLELLDSQGELPLRYGYGIGWFFGTVKSPKTEMMQHARLVGSGNDKVWVTSLTTMSVDGGTDRHCSNQKKTQPFGTFGRYYPSVGQCYTDSEYRGLPGRSARISGNYYREWILENGLQGIRLANTHTEGDRAVSQLLDIAEQVQKQKGPAATAGWYIDHCSLVNPVDFPRAARLGVGFSCSPKFIDLGSELMAKVYGEKVANTFVVPVKSMLAAGAKVVYEVNGDRSIWFDVETLLTRKDKNGKVWGPQERIDRVTALKMMTSWAAEYVLKPDKLGSIEPGKLADLVVLDRDYMTIPEEQISDIRPQLTMLDGKIGFLHTRFAQEYNLRPAGALISTYEDLRARRGASEGWGTGASVEPGGD